jgi:NAD(P)-dependent dehydrogenase (short-subunit alcohol dehydrogenase family)
MVRLDGKVAVVTGAAGGIGRGISLAFAKEGCTVAAVDRNAAGLETVGRELRALDGRALAITADVGLETDARRAVERTVAELGRLDLLVNAAQAWGAGDETAVPLTPLEELPAELWDATFASGVRATFYCSKLAFPHLRVRGGTIINFCSWWGMAGKSEAAAYNANKEAIRALTRTAAREWGRFGITVNVLSPAAETDALASWALNNPSEYRERLEEIPLRRYGDPERDIGRVAVFLASEDAAFITGSTVMADGGIYMSP